MRIIKAYDNNPRLNDLLSDRDDTINRMKEQADDDELKRIEWYLHLPQLEQDLIYLTTLDLKQTEIAEIYGVSYALIVKLFKKIRTKLK